MPGVWTIVVAAGSARRFGSDKLSRLLVGRSVLNRSIDGARAASDGVVLVVAADRDRAGLAPVDAVVEGGSTRSESVRAGLARVPGDAEVICVHDAARPLASAELYQRVIAAVRAGADAAVPGVDLVDTVKRVDPDGWVLDTPERSTLRAVQTPQAFRAELLRRVHGAGGEATDDAGLVEQAGGRVLVVPGDPSNRKLTTPGDFILMSEELRS